MDSSTSRVVVAFEGEGAGVEELTWGQRDVWDLMRHTGRTMNIGGTVRAGDGETAEGVAALLRYVMSRHQALRTRLRLVDGEPPRQVVSASGETALEVVDVHVPADPDTVAEAVRVRYQTTMFDPVREWPVRMAVVRSGGTVTHVVVMYYHVVVDGFGIEAVVRDLAHLDRRTGHATAPPAGLQPLELARRQRSPGVLRQSEQSLRYWQRQLRRVPPRTAEECAGARPRFAEVAGVSPRFWEVVCVSPAMALAVRLISARTRVASGAVLLAAYAVALARVTGADPAVVQVVVSNRFRPGFEEAVGSLRQFGLCVIDVAGTGFDEVVARAWTATLGAFKHGYYDTAAHQEMIARAGGVDLSCYLNDRRTQTRDDSSGPAPTAEQVRAAQPDTTLRWGVKEPTYDGSLYLHVEDAAAGADAVAFTLWGDTYRYTPAGVERCARELEAAVIAAALEPP
ncbi:condensation domain-containing protein [Dactylosporangium sp. AC04546]|uniref:condensation domain-containing protein n=1 Tax=Dactylosporangium sp. AC04546 TaxID=2862460 RepID=UPI001EDECB4C|nr:condensation domain-containing protein [Dactylosporangium sp. AC04546]WVK81147.1 condensation domain-containing protein [Dactylosporangium sp. AC04546]